MTVRFIYLWNGFHMLDGSQLELDLQYFTHMCERNGRKHVGNVNTAHKR